MYSRYNIPPYYDTWSRKPQRAIRLTASSTASWYSEFRGIFKTYLKENDNILINSKYHSTLGAINRFSKLSKIQLKNLLVVETA
jgi:hypothetical protein